MYSKRSSSVRDRHLTNQNNFLETVEILMKSDSVWDDATLYQFLDLCFEILYEKYTSLFRIWVP
jgi:hypothetical protein